MKKSIYKKLVKEVTKLENKSYSNGYALTKIILEIADKLEVNFKLGKMKECFEEEADVIHTAYFENITVEFYNKCNGYISEKIVKIVVSENN